MTERAVLESNIKCSREARELVELAGEQPQRFWEALAQFAQEKLPPEPAPAERNPPMTDDEANKFERVFKMPRGIHQGQPVGDVPCEYLIFWTEPDEFSRLLQRYVRSRTFARRQEEG